MRTVILSVILLAVLAFPLYASQSTITESEGYACMGEDKSRKQTEQAALSDAKRKAGESALTYIKSETEVKDFELQKDIVSAYTNAEVRVIEEQEKGWYKDDLIGDCYRVRIKAEVTPDMRAMENLSKDTRIADDPTAPLSVRVWTDKKEYRQGEKIKLYIKGNKPFYTRVIYKDAGGSPIQLLPNPYREDNYFNGGVVYEIPSGNDKFDLEVTPPFGEEDITVYASTSPLGELSLEAGAGVYQIKTKAKDIGERTRGVKVKEKQGEKTTPASEFVEDRAVVKTGR